MNHNDVLFLAGLVAALVPAVVALITLFKVQSLHVLVNSRLTELLRLNHAEGIQQGKDLEKDKQESDNAKLKI